MYTCGANGMQSSLIVTRHMQFSGCGMDTITTHALYYQLEYPQHVVPIVLQLILYHSSFPVLLFFPCSSILKSIQRKIVITLATPGETSKHHWCAYIFPIAMFPKVSKPESHNKNHSPNRI